MLIAIVGAPSAGKTTLAHTVTALLKEEGRSVVMVPEYARTVLERGGKGFIPVDLQPLVALGQMADEMTAKRCYEYVVCDSAVFLAYLYALRNVTGAVSEGCLPPEMHAEAVSKLEALSRLHRYDYVFFLPPREFQSDGVRSEEHCRVASISALIQIYCQGEFRFPSQTKYVVLGGGRADLNARIVLTHIR